MYRKKAPCQPVGSWRWIEFVIIFMILPGAALSTPKLRDSDQLRITLQLNSEFSPFEEILYELKIRNGNATISHIKKYTKNFGRKLKVGLIPKEDFFLLLDELESFDILKLGNETSVQVLGGFKVNAVIVVDSQEHTFSFYYPELIEDIRYTQCLDLLRKAALKYAGEIPFHNPFFVKGEFGWARVESNPESDIVIDGQSLGRTPSPSIPLLVGNHDVVLSDDKSNIVKYYSITIEPGKTTYLNVELR